MILLYFLKKQLSIKKSKKTLKTVRYFSLLELLIVLSLLSSMIVVGSWWGLRKYSSNNKLKQSVLELTNYLNHVHAATVYSGVDAFVEVRKVGNQGFLFQTHFTQPISKNLCLKKKFLVQHFDTIKLNNNLNEDVILFFDSFLGKTEEGILLLSMKGKVHYIEIKNFPLRGNSNK